MNEKAVRELVEGLQCMIIGACAVGVRNPHEKAVLQEAADKARALITKYDLPKQDRPLVCSPFSGKSFLRGLSSERIRDTYRNEIWTHNPWTEAPRTAAEIEADPYGYKIDPEAK